MRNLIFIIILTVVYIYGAAYFVFADEPQPKNADPCSRATAAWLRDYIGCPCTTDRRDADATHPYYPVSNTDNPGSSYCAVGSGSKRGVIRQCNGNNECDQGFFSKFRYCQDNRCNQCLEDGPSQTCKAMVESLYIYGDRSLSLVNAQCLRGYSYEYNNIYVNKKKQCYYCLGVKGPESAKYKIILFFLDYPTNGTDIDTAKGIVERIITTQPYTYLYNKGKLAFQLVLPSGAPNQFIRKREARDFCYPDYIETLIKRFVEKICPSAKEGLIIAIDVPAGFFGYTYPESNEIYSVNNSKVILHELGHKFGELGEEYYWPGSSFFTGTEINLNKVASQGYRICDKFDVYGVNRENCFSFLINNQIPLYFDYPSFPILKKSTPDSVMSQMKTSEERYNIISCAGILTKLDSEEFPSNDAGIRKAVQFCEDNFAPVPGTQDYKVIPQPK